MIFQVLPLIRVPAPFPLLCQCCSSCEGSALASFGVFLHMFTKILLWSFAFYFFITKNVYDAADRSLGEHKPPNHLKLCCSQTKKVGETQINPLRKAGV